MSLGAASAQSFGVEAGASPSSLRARPADAEAAAGLEQSWVTGAGTWAVVAMGHLHQVRNTFWQVFFRPAGKVRWTLVTPPGVASNGGFAASGTAGATGDASAVTAGFEPSRKLRYSPIARTTNDGRSWVAGTLPTALLPVADAVVTAPGGSVFALVRSKGGTLLRSRGSLTSWSRVATLAAIEATPDGRRCGVVALSAVAVPAGGSSAELGTACAKPGTVGLFRRAASGWAATKARVPAAAGAELTVLRLECGPEGTSALLEARRAKTASLVALWRSGPTAGWEASPSAPLHGSVLSTAVLADGSLLVVTGRGDGHASELLWSAGPGKPWRSLGAPPRGTQAVSAAPAAASGAGPGKSAATTSASAGATGPGALSALVVSGSEMTVWQRSAAGAWARTGQRFRVPIEYGSST